MRSLIFIEIDNNNVVVIIIIIIIVPLHMGKGLNSITSMEDDNTTTDGIKPKAIMADPNTADILISDDGGT